MRVHHSSWTVHTPDRPGCLRQRFVTFLPCYSHPRRRPLASALTFLTLYKRDRSLFVPGKPFQSCSVMVLGGGSVDQHSEKSSKAERQF